MYMKTNLNNANIVMKNSIGNNCALQEKCIIERKTGFIREDKVIRDKETYPEIKIIKPFFWKECRFCGREFKREKGYSIWDYTRVNAHLYSSYCCSRCAISTEDVRQKIEKSKIPPKPPAPPKPITNIRSEK